VRVNDGWLKMTVNDKQQSKDLIPGN
jgi:hypothetical protein